jgi:copper chaperone CopZ
MSKNIKLLIIVFLGLSFSLSGYAQDSKTTDLKVEVDFHCMNGKAKLENHFAEINGIKSYIVDFETKTLNLKYNSEVISKDQIIKEIENVGYYTEFSDRSKPIKKACSHGGNKHHDNNHD